LPGEVFAKAAAGIRLIEAENMARVRLRINLFIASSIRYELPYAQA
jgi:hypothetical protein